MNQRNHALAMRAREIAMDGTTQDIPRKYAGWDLADAEAEAFAEYRERARMYGERARATGFARTAWARVRRAYQASVGAGPVKLITG